jgi:hypothetical protein
MAPRRDQPCRIALRVVVMDEAEMKPGVRAQAQIFDRRVFGRDLLKKAIQIWICEPLPQAGRT